jgi:hypothetical protein
LIEKFVSSTMAPSLDLRQQHQDSAFTVVVQLAWLRLLLPTEGLHLPFE